MLHKDLTGADLHINKVHATTHVEIGTDPLVLAESQVADLVADLADKVEIDDARLSDARVPTAHDHAESGITNLVTDLSGKAPLVHGHVKADVADFPVSMPASDVSTWAKEETKPAYTPSEIGSPSGSGSSTGDNTGDQTLSGLGAVATGDSRLSDARTPTAHSHVKASITDFPALGTASPLDVPATGNASVTQVVKGDDTRLTSAGTGNVVGPASATAGHLATFADETGKNIQDGGAIPTTLPASDVYAWAKEATKPAYTPTELGAEAVANKSISVPTDAASDTKYPSVKAVKDYADGLVAGLLDYRGAFDASGNAYPTTGGSGTAGAAMKGDMWAISGAGTLGGVAIQVGDAIIAKIDTPAQTAGNWNTLNTNVSYVPEDQANKENTTLDTSTVKYPTNNLVKAGLDAKVASSDARLSDARVASDVSAWAKAGSKPAYASSEITNISAAGQALINDADAAAQRATLGAAAFNCGSYAGNGANNRAIAVGFQPKLVMVWSLSTAYYGARIDAIDGRILLATTAAPNAVNIAFTVVGLVLSATGLVTGTVGSGVDSCNVSGINYRWEAWG